MLKTDYIAPSPEQVGERIVVEFRNDSLNHYFITAEPAESALLDAGVVVPGWQRTDERQFTHLIVLGQLDDFVERRGTEATSDKLSRGQRGESVRCSDHHHECSERARLESRKLPPSLDA